MVWLPDGEQILKICLLISTEYTNVTDRQTDGQTHSATASRGKKSYSICESYAQTKNGPVFLLILFFMGHV